MAFDGVPWMVSGGLHSAALGRKLAYRALEGEGVFGASDCKVLPLVVPGAGVRVSPGGLGVFNKYPGVVNETYVDSNDADVIVNTTATSSGGPRSDMVVYKIEDPDFGGQVPADVENGPYGSVVIIPGVSATAVDFDDLGLNYPGIALARIDRPASTATVQASHIVDLRKIASPKRQRYVDLSGATNGSGVAGTQYIDGVYKNVSRSRQFYVPKWATLAKFTINVSGLVLIDGQATGWIRGIFASTIIGNFPAKFDENWGAAQGFSRSTYTCGGEVSIPADKRGTYQYMHLQGQRDSGPGRLQLDSGTNITFDVEFFETAE